MLDMGETLSGTSLLNAVVRLRARHPSVRKIWSDCGTNFTAAEKMLEKAVEECGSQESAVGRPLEWARVAPRASHRAGVWERIIGLTKRILVSLVGKGDTTLDVFRTVLCQAEYIL